jgi:hypothetical protein
LESQKNKNLGISEAKKSRKPGRRKISESQNHNNLENQ